MSDTIENTGQPVYAPPDSLSALRGIVAMAVDAIISTDDSYRITLFNPAAERIFGYRQEEVLDQPLEILLPEGARDAHREHLEHFRRSITEGKEMGVRGEIWGRRRTGELFPAEASISKVRIGDSTHFTAVMRDVTMQRRTDQERDSLLLRERAARAAAEAAERRVAFLSEASELLHSSLAYEETFGALVGLIVPELARYCVFDVVDEDGAVSRLHVTHADPAMQEIADRLRSYPRTETSFFTRHALVTGESELLESLTAEILASRAEDEEHLAIIRALAPTSMMIVPMLARKRVLGAILFARDAASPAGYDAADLALAEELARRAASALDNAQLYRRAQRAVRARDDVLGVVSHDLRNPLSVISMCTSSLLTNGTADEARTRDVLHTVQESARWAQRLIQDLLDVTAIEAGGLSIARRSEDPVMLVTRAALLYEELAAARGIHLVTELPDQLPSVDADADRILQAIGNLVANAFKFTPAGGEVRLAARAEEDTVLFVVSDSGPGIPEEDRQHVFERFWTSRRSSGIRGTGMGLAIVSGIVSAHGGRVWAEASESGGAAIVLGLPVAQGSGSVPS